MTQWKWEFQRKMDIVKRLGFAPEFAELAGSCIYINRNGKIDFYWDENGANETSKMLITKAKQDSQFLKNWTGEIEKNTSNWQVLTESFAGCDFAVLSNEELFSLYSQFLNVHPTIAKFAAFIRMIIHLGVDELKELLSVHITDERELQDSLTVLTSTCKESFNGEEEITFFKLGIALLDSGEDPVTLSNSAKEKILKHMNTFCWIPCGYYDEAPHEFDYYVHRLKRIQRDLNEAKNTLAQLETLASVLKKRQDRILNEVKLNEETLRLMQTLQECVYYKDYVRGVLNKGYWRSYPLFAELGKRCNLNMLDVKFLFKEEVKKALFEDDDFSELVAQRKEFHVMYCEYGGIIKILFGDEAKKYVTQAEGVTGDVKEISGMPANGGYAKAKVRIFDNPEDVQNEAHDFILVASMTTPEYVIAMQKALAIVTDEGGITCHAAIVAREMNKPCIIGTKIATKILENGDIVEVDADKGVVRKL